MRLATYYIETFGCEMNYSDSTLIEISMDEHGFQKVENPDEADVLIYNTCSIREHAEIRVQGRMRTIRPKVKKRKGIIITAGCMAQRLQSELIKNKACDMVVGPYQSPIIGSLVRQYENNHKKNTFVKQDAENFHTRINSLDANYKDDKFPWHKYVTITHGCGNFCSYCIVPYVRGPLISYPSKDIIEQVHSLADHGFTEITLLGQNVNQYGLDNQEIPFYQLLDEIAQIDGIKRLAYETSHPMDFNEELIKTIARHDNISKCIHLPLQSGSNKILKAMNRHYNIEHYLNLVDLMHKYLPEFGITTDLIVGFPGETKENFEETLNVVRQVGYDTAFMYAYSPRRGTKSFEIKEEIDQAEKSARLHELIYLQRSLEAEKLNKTIGRNYKFIGERISKKADNEIMGKTFLGHPVVLPGDQTDLGQIREIKICERRGATLYGEKINS